MQDFAEELRIAFGLIITGDPALWAIVLLSLKVSLIAVGIAALLGMPIGAALAVGRFPGRRVVIVALNALMGLPPVVVGLLVYLMLSRSGPLGVLQLLYTPTAMIIAQVLLVTPIIAALTRQTIETLDAEYTEQLRSLGISLRGRRAMGYRPFSNDPSDLAARVERRKRILKNHLDRLASCAQLFALEMGHVASSEKDRSAIGLHQTD